MASKKQRKARRKAAILGAAMLSMDSPNTPVSPKSEVQPSNPNEWTNSDRLGAAFVCLAGIMAIVLFLIEKNRWTISILLSFMVLLAIFPVLHFCKNPMLRVFVFAGVFIVTLAFGYGLWPKKAIEITSSVHPPVVAAPAPIVPAPATPHPATPEEIAAQIAKLLPKTGGFLQLDSKESNLDIGNDTRLVAGHTVTYNPHYINAGQIPVDNAVMYLKLMFVQMSRAPGGDQQVDDTFRKAVAVKMKLEPLKGNTVGVGEGLNDFDTSPPLQQITIDGLADGTWRMYMLTTVFWRNRDGSQGTAHSCSWESKIDKTAILTANPPQTKICELKPDTKIKKRVPRHDQNCSGNITFTNPTMTDVGTAYYVAGANPPCSLKQNGGTNTRVNKVLDWQVGKQPTLPSTKPPQ